MADELLCTLISASEKASIIARLCRENEDLFSLLIENKGERNNEIDFKTFADVFIQQVIVKEVSSKFGKLGDQVKGEENNLFTNTLGESVTVEIKSDANATADVIAKVLGEHKNAASLLANAAHEPTGSDVEAEVCDETLAQIRESGLDLSNLGIWVDPIDCTSQYVKGIENSVPLSSGVFETGLQCVLVLIGVHCLDTGLPVIGVINQPFNKSMDSDLGKKWSGRCTWGFSYNGVKKNDIPQILNGNRKPLVVLSMHDPVAKATVEKLSDAMDKCLSRGAGYKCITVADRSSDLFLYTNSGSYKWDTCAPHAILLSCGGGIAVLKDAVRSYDASLKVDTDIGSVFENCQVLYCQRRLGSSTNWTANTGGIIAYNSSTASAKAANQIMKAIDTSAFV